MPFAILFVGFAKHISNKDIPRVFQVWGNLQDQLAREDKKFRYADIQRVEEHVSMRVL